MTTPFSSLEGGTCCSRLLDWHPTLDRGLVADPCMKNGIRQSVGITPALTLDTPEAYPQPDLCPHGD
jgi:hypothetical protein